jgi:Ni/Fe-hydrogenase subunit HybB-like protein
MVLAPFVILCGMLILKRLIFGLGSVTDLNGLPLGLWISFADDRHRFACGGWALAWAVYVFNRGEYHPLVRPALLGEPVRLFAGWPLHHHRRRPLLEPALLLHSGFFNTSSVLFETAVCMTIYIGVMALEFAPVLMEKFGWKVSLARINKVMFFILALGALLPTMHQSSMGSLMIVAGRRSIRSGKATSCCRSSPCSPPSSWASPSWCLKAPWCRPGWRGAAPTRSRFLQS